MLGSRDSPGWAGRAHPRRPPGGQERGVGDQRFQSRAAGGRKWQEPGTSGSQRRWLSDNQDHRAAIRPAGGQLGTKQEAISGRRSTSGCKSQEAGAKKNLVGQVPSRRKSLTANLRLRKDD